MPTPFLSIALMLLSQPGELPYQSRIKALEASKPFIETTSIGTSRQNRSIQALWVTDFSDKTTAPADRPTLILVAGIDGRHRVGIDTAVGVAEKLIADHKDLLKTVRFGIVPCLNPDNYAWNLDAGHPKTDYGRTFAPHDADHDARINEDAGEDLNGDGVISVMRIKDPKPGSDLRAEFCIDPDNAKLLKKPDATKGQKAEYALITEGSDNDGDGKFNEDGIGGPGGAGGGTDLNMNFPYRWPEFSDGAGPYPLSEPESLTFAQWLIGQTNVVAVLAYTPGDTILNQPPAGRFEQSGSLTSGIENGDKAACDEVAKLFKEATKMTGAPGFELAGSLTGWAYAHEGMLSFSTPVWVRPDLVTKDPPRREGGAGDAERKDGNAPAAEGEAGGMSQEEIQKRIRDFQSATPAERERMLQDFLNLPPEVQARIRAASGLAPGQNPPTGQPATTPAPAAQPAGAQPTTPPAGGPRGAGGRQPGAGGGGGGQPGGRRGGGGRGPGGSGPGGGGPGGGAPAAAADDKKAEPDSEDPKWLKYDADQVKAGATSGFLDWKPFKHPQLGEVEIGGFIPGFKLNPPDAELPRLAEEQTKFLSAFAAKFPKLTAQAPVVEKLGPGLYRINVRVVNDGAMASMPEVNTKARHGLPSLLTIDVPLARLISGEKIVRSWVIAGSGGQMQAEWIITGEDGSAVDVLFRPSIGAKSTLHIDLKEAAK